MMRLCLMGLAICSVLATSARAARYGDLDVTLLPQPSPEGGSQPVIPRGYVELRISIRNSSSKNDHRVRLYQPVSGSSSRGSELQRLSRTVQSVHGTTMIVSLFQPPLEIYNSQIGVEIDGVLQEERLSGSDRQRGYTRGARPTLNVLTSRGVPQDWKDNVRTANSGEILFQRSELPLSEWSPHWLGYTSFDIVLLTRQEADSIPADVRTALKRYVEVGGVMMIHDPDRPGRPAPAEIFRDEFFNQGKGRLLEASKPAIPAALKDSALPGTDERAYPVGFGQIISSPESESWPLSLWAERMKPQSAPLDQAIRIVHESRVPVRGILALVILFAVGIGPINLWLLSRRKKKMWLWWNVPAVSLATCLIIFVYSLLAEGVTGQARNVALTLLDERSHHAATCGYASYYCPLTPSDGVHFSSDTEVIPLGNDSVDHWRRSESGRQKSVDWTQDQHLESGWVLSRVPVCFSIRKNETRRERLAFHTRKPGELSVVNGLGADIESLHYRDSSGALYLAGEVTVGQEATMKKVDDTPSAAREDLRQAYLKGWDQTFTDMQTNPVKYLQNGTYLAVLRKNPFLEESLPAVTSTGSFGIVYGIAAEGGDGR